MTAVALLFVAVLTTAVADTIDWARVQPVEELDHYWARLPPALHAFRNTSRITNGQEAEPGQFPHQTLVLSEYGVLTTMCGGSLLTQHFVLTAGHCVMLDQSTLASGGTVILGAHNRLEVEPTQQRIRYGRSGIVVHPQYAVTNYRFDVALVQLNSAAIYTVAVQPVRLPARSDPRQFEGFIGTVSGFGRTSDTETVFAPVLRYTVNPVMANVDCLGFWSVLLVEPQNVCLSGEGGRSSCNGDSGGPLTVQESGSSLLIGVTSFGSGSGCTRGMPTVYARTSFFMDWISANSDYVDG
ncbi:brachyurin-like [Anopheles nili]|uniref:brachyurin-like n=1 Tax=Anopheles nili TaxID=185578 RepID=UPI00237ABD98|nr:brachyurin-like [Anopheles nili]